MKAATLVLIHGYPFDKTMWHPVVAALGSRAKTLLPDLPGFGSAPPLQTVPSIEAYADHVIDFASAHGVKEAIFAGMSMGGYVALAIAEKYPSLTLGVGLISTQAAADTPEAREGRFRMIDKIREHGVKAAVEASLPKLFAQGRENNPEFARHARQGAEKAGVAGLIWALEAMAGRPDRTEFITELDKPVLVAHGRDDKFISLAKAQALADQLRRPVAMAIPGAGHATPLENPDAVASALARLVDAVRQSSANEARA